jgi:Excalibur calcium-binding domain
MVKEEKEPVENESEAEPIEEPEETVIYKNCSEVRDAGAAPIRKGEPGYSSKLDRDGDGIACDQ